MKLRKRLLAREKSNNPILVGLVGCGQMGTDIVNQTHMMNGMEVSVIADVEIGRAKKAYNNLGFNENEISGVEDSASIDEKLEAGYKALTKNAFIVPKSEKLDVIIDATGAPEVGAKLGLESINNKKHIVMLNVEADVCVGPILKQMADNAGVVYTGAAGDEPAAIMELYNFARSMGYEIVAAGKGKNNPLRPSATPDDLREEADKRGVSEHMLTSFVEGTKTMVEMAAVSNATGLKIDIPGMHGPRSDVENLAETFSLQENGGILNNKGVVDYSLGEVAPGVFVVFTTDNERIKFSLEYSKMGSGPNYVLYRPYHLVSLETPLTAARAEIFNEADIAPEKGLVTEVVTVAKRDLNAGEVIDGMGGYTVHGSVEDAEKARKQNLLPLSLSKDAVATQKIAQGELITYDMVEIKKDSILYKLRSLQEETMQEPIINEGVKS